MRPVSNRGIDMKSLKLLLRFLTVGGLVLRQLGRVPKRNEVIDIDGLRFQVLRADSRRLYTLLVDPPKPANGVDQPAA